MTAIYKREVKAYFHSFIGCLFLSAMLFMMGIYFTVYNMLNGYPHISFVLQSVVFLFMITMPILTMRMLAEERRQKTDQLILTAPVTVGKIVLGKYLAVVTIFAVPTVILGITPIVLSFFGTFQLGVSYTALLGFFLYGCLALSIGLFLSSLTESIVISAVLTFIALFLGYLMPGICSLISATGNILTWCLSSLDMVGRFDAMSGGNLAVDAVIYFVSFTMLMLFLTTQSIQKRRYSVSGGFRIGAYSMGMIVVALMLTIAVNLLAGQLPESILSIDMTSNRLFTLSDDAKEFVKNVEEDITIYVLENEEYKDFNLDLTLRKIEDLSGHITVTYVDPMSNPRFYTNYTETAPSLGSLIISGPKRSRVIDYNDIYAYEMDYMSYEYQITGYDGEGQIVSALAYVTTEDMPKIYVITGHGELALEGQFTGAIQKGNIAYENLALVTVDQIPEDAKAILIDAPTSDFSGDDADKVINYLKQGGHAILIPTLTEEPLVNFNQILDYYGVSVTDGMIVENNSGLYYQSDQYYLFPEIISDEITQNVLDGYIFAPFAQGLSYEEDVEDVLYSPLLVTSDSSFSKVNFMSDTSFEKAEGDIDGPFVIALHVMKAEENDTVSEAVIVATENLFTESADSVVPGNNVKLFGSILGTLVEHESALTLPVKYYDAEAITFSTRACLVAGLFSILILPVGCLVAGFCIWYRRRKR